MTPAHCFVLRIAAGVILCVALGATEAAAQVETSAVEQQLSALQHRLDISWILISAALVLLMQGGFLCLESGVSRAKNSINVAMKNLSDFFIASAVYWAFGFAIMFGTTAGGLLGTDGFFLGAEASTWLTAFFLFQITFCGTSTTIVSGAVAERMRFGAYMVMSFVLSGVLYPVFGHWAWGGVIPGTGPGWLANLGFIDFAGSSVVHSVGGWASLAAVIVIGPRIGRFENGGRKIHGHNLPLAMLGVVLLWFSWFGFNGGSTLAMDDRVPLIILNTCLSASFAGGTALLTSRFLTGQPDASETMNGCIAGLVGVTAGCHVLTPAMSAVVGVTSALWCSAAMRLLDRLEIDDAVGAVPVHAVGGIWGTLCVALLGTSELWGNGHTRWEQLGVQLLGVGVCAAWSFGVGYGIFRLINVYFPLRVSREEEIQGLNVAEHGATTEVIDLLLDMHEQVSTGDFHRRVHVEPHTEVGQIADGYNRVLDRVNDEAEKVKLAHRESERLHKQLVEVALQAGKAEIATDVLHNVGNVLNSVNVSAGIVLERLDGTRGAELQRAVDLLRANLDNPTKFFAPGAPGSILPDYLEELSSLIQQEQDGSQQELRQLVEHLEHIKAIVATQQSFAGVTGLREPVDLAKLMFEAETLNATSFERHAIEVARDFAALPPVISERQKLLQIVVNLMRNAKEALTEGRADGRKLSLRVERCEEDENRVRIQIADNGPGISRENLVRIFSHGFTTKKDGHGFGLHSCANAAKEMGGSISVHSDGPGLGAVFTLEFPLEVAELEPCPIR